MRFDGPQLGANFIYDPAESATPKVRKVDENEDLISSGQIDELGNRLVTNQKSSSRYHSKWLSMIYPRLKLSRNLLSEDGIIFISIDCKM